MGLMRPAEKKKKLSSVADRRANICRSTQNIHANAALSLSLSRYLLQRNEPAECAECVRWGVSLFSGHMLNFMDVSQSESFLIFFLELNDDDDRRSSKSVRVTWIMDLNIKTVFRAEPDAAAHSVVKQ